LEEAVIGTKVVMDEAGIKASKHNQRKTESGTAEGARGVDDDLGFDLIGASRQRVQRGDTTHLPVVSDTPTSPTL
jgi:hypothetical protein